jgi:hypothetical protein
MPQEPSELTSFLASPFALQRQLGGQEYDLSIPAVVQALHTRLAGGGLAGQGGGPELSDEEGLGVGGGGGGDQGGVLTSDIGEDSEAMMMTGGGDVMAMQGECVR